ncbi:hypothetical protein ABW19_dt0203472 [Dactylella cylindrospora]|nr:hypothetical protein ABW19_dt0203472 [Dactylella cylindrospora]
MAEPSRAADEDFPVPIQRPAGFAAGAEASAAPSSSIQTIARGQAQAPKQQKSPRPCRFYPTKAGCKNGDACPYVHDPSISRGDDRPGTASPGSGRPDPVANRRTDSSPGSVRHTARGASGTDAIATRRHHPIVDPSKVVRRPVPAGENNPEVRRKNEINQLKRRWGNLFDDVDQAQGLYRLELKQSEDFPYDLDALRIELFVPFDYPNPDSDGPTVRVLNEDIPRGHQINIEKGFTNLVRAASKTTRLLDLLNNLDKRLETFLSSEKAATFKIVPNMGAIVQETAKLIVNSVQAQPVEKTPQQPQRITRDDPPPPTYTDAERSAASARRAVETRQLEARFRQASVFWKNADGTTYKVPLEPRMRNMLPAALLLLKAVDIKVPQLYPLEPCKIAFDRSFPSSITSGIERNFSKRAQEKPEVPLMAQLNYLAQNIHNMIELESEPEPKPVQESIELANPEPKELADADSKAVSSTESGLILDTDKPHVVRVESMRPPEWDHPDDDSETESDESSEDEATGGLPTENQEALQELEAPSAPEPVSVVERGTSISFPDIKLKNIELLELKTINITMKCTRCKTVADINNIKAKENKHSRPKLLGCEKCANVIGIGSHPLRSSDIIALGFPIASMNSNYCIAAIFDMMSNADYRREFIHENHTRAGFLDLSGCTVVDLLPSEFVPTCAACSTTLTAGIQGVTRSQTMFANCRSCFAKMSLFLPEIRFLKISEQDVDLSVGRQIKRQVSQHIYCAPPKQCGAIKASSL